MLQLLHCWAGLDEAWMKRRCKSIWYPLAANFASGVGPCGGIVEPFKCLLHVTAHPQFLAVELQAPMGPSLAQDNTVCTYEHNIDNGANQKAPCPENVCYVLAVTKTKKNTYTKNWKEGEGVCSKGAYFWKLMVCTLCIHYVESKVDYNYSQ